MSKRGTMHHFVLCVSDMQCLDVYTVSISLLSTSMAGHIARHCWE